ncbi:MAG: hypothetical protein AB8G14_01670 [Ilumatobacter sp.]
MARSLTTLDTVDQPIDADLLARRVVGFGLAEHATLGSVLAPSAGGSTTLLVFLRHFG